LFLELTTAADERLIVNSDHVEHISNQSEGCRITFAAQKVDGRANAIVVKESFDELSALLRGHESGYFRRATAKTASAI
jgi:hypothetical protein